MCGASRNSIDPEEKPTERNQVVIELLRWIAPRALSEASLRRELAHASEHEEFLRSRQIDSLLYLACGDTGLAQRVYNKIWKRQLETLGQIVADLETAGIPTIIFKSAELTVAGFRDQALGLCSDLDLLVPRQCVAEARRRLFCLGFRHADFRPETGELIDFDIAVTAKTELSHYELPFLRLLTSIDLNEDEIAFVKAVDDDPVYIVDGKPILILEVDLHHGLSRAIKSEPLFERAVASSHGVGMTLSPADHVWFNLVRLYTEVGIHGKESFRPIAYTLPLIASGEVDWDVVGGVAIEHSFGPSLFYYLQFAAWLAPGYVPEQLLHALHPCRNDRLRDWGWQLSKLLETMDPFPLAAVAEHSCVTPFEHICKEENDAMRGAILRP